MHERVLPRGSGELLAKLSGRGEPDILRGWALAGGTGLALRLGHRVSEDLDFFRTDDVDVQALHVLFKQCDVYETLQDSQHTVTVLLMGVKLSFFRVRDPFLFPATPYRFFAVADARDVALMKLAAISSRGSRKDFVDLHTILRDGPTLQDYFALLPKKYGASRVNAYHILKCLTYFADAEQEPMPEMLEPFDWEECKRFFVREARAILLPG